MSLPRGVADGLASIVGAASVLTKPEDIIPYSFDGTAALRQVPAAVVFPHTDRRCLALREVRGRAVRCRSSRADPAPG